MERSQSIAEQGQGRVRWRECGEEGGEEEAETWREEGQGLQAGPFNVTLPGTITEAKQGDPCLISSSPNLHHYLCPQPPTRSRTFPFSLSTTHTASVQPSNVPSLPLPPPGRATLQPLTSHRPSVASRTSTIRVHHNTYTIQDLCPLDPPQTGTRIMLTQPFHRTITHPRPAIPPHPPTQAHLLQVPLQLDDGLGLCSRAFRTQSTQSDSYTHIHLPALKSKQTCARLGQTISLSPLLGAERTAGALGNCSSVARRVFQRKVTGERVCAALNPVSGHLVVGDEGGRLEVWGPEGLSGEAGEEVEQVSCRGEKEGGSEGKEESSQAQVTLQSRGREGGGGSVEARLPSTSAKAS